MRDIETRFLMFIYRCLTNPDFNTTKKLSRFHKIDFTKLKTQNK